MIEFKSIGRSMKIVYSQSKQNLPKFIGLEVAFSDGMKVKPKHKSNQHNKLFHKNNIVALFPK